MLLSLDVAFANTGWCLIDRGRIKKCGVITTSKSKSKTTRVSEDRAWRASVLALSLAHIISENRVQGVIGELPHGGAQSYTAGLMMGMAVASVSSVCAVMNIPTEWTNPSDVKKAVTGRGNATKEEMMRAVSELFPDAPFPKSVGKFEHIADAAAAYVALKPGNLVKLFGDNAKVTIKPKRRRKR